MHTGVHGRITFVAEDVRFSLYAAGMFFQKTDDALGIKKPSARPSASGTLPKGPGVLPGTRPSNWPKGPGALPGDFKRSRTEATRPSQATETQELTFEFKGSGKKQTWQCFEADTQLELNLLALAAVKCQQSQTKRMHFGDELQWLYDETIFDPRDSNYQTCIVGEQTSRDTGKVREVRAKDVYKGWGRQDALL